MKNKLLKTVSALALACLLAFGVSACGEGNWKGNVALTTPGNVASNGGFVIDTENYVYFINGEVEYTADNKLGSPVKGALMVAAKSDLSSPKTVVPKIIASGDYNAGIYLYKDRLYYATPSVKKDSNGKVANDHLEFCSSDLAGNNRTEHLTLNGNSTVFRYVLGTDNDVYLVYYNADDKKIISLNTATGKSLTVAEDPTTYNFVSNEALSAAAVIYTVTPKVEDTTADAGYNNVYAYKAGMEEAALIKEGNKTAGLPNETTYAVTLIKGDNIYYTETKTGGSGAKYYGSSVADFIDGEANRTEYTENTSLLADTTLFVSDKAYVAESDYIYSYNATLETSSKEVVAKVNASTLLGAVNGDIYYVNSSNNLARVELGNPDAMEVKISEGTVVTDWYKIQISGGRAFWLDNSAEGLSYVNVADLSANVIDEKDNEDDEEEVTGKHLDGVKMLGVMNDDDRVSVVSTKINALSSNYSTMVYEDEKWTAAEDVAAARAAYNALGDKLKKKVSADTVKTFEKYESYLDVSGKLKEIIDLGDGVTVNAENVNEYQAKIDAIKKIIKDKELSESVLVENGMYYMAELQKKINEFKNPSND